jgi:uncharacterized membrane protein YjjP (DUF1212 family)
VPVLFLAFSGFCAAAFLLGYFVRSWMVVSGVAAVGIALVVCTQLTSHLENPAFVAVVQSFAASLIVASSFAGLRLRNARSHKRDNR